MDIFKAGADIKEMATTQFATNYKTDFLGHWTKVTSIRKPIIAAVNGYAVRLIGAFCHFTHPSHCVFKCDSA